MEILVNVLIQSDNKKKLKKRKNALVHTLKLTNLDFLASNHCGSRLNSKIYGHGSKLNSKGMGADTQPAITCSKVTIETPEQGVKYVQS